MQRIQLIINDKMRLGNLEGIEPGDYVIADEWNVCNRIGPSFEAITLAARPKAISIDYENHTIDTHYNFDSEEGKKIVELSAGRYNPKVGYFWGMEVLCQVVDDDGPVLPWFFCTDSLRQLLARFKIGTRLAVSSAEVDVKSRFTFFSPVIHQISERLTDEELLHWADHIREFMAPFKETQK